MLRPITLSILAHVTLLGGAIGLKVLTNENPSPTPHGSRVEVGLVRPASKARAPQPTRPSLERKTISQAEAAPVSGDNSMAPVASEPGIESAAPGTAFLNQVQDRIRQHLRYPRPLAARRIGGTVRVHFRILETGEVADVSVLGSSGHPQLDQAALDAIRDAAPFAVEKEKGHPDWSIEVPIQFKLDSSASENLAEGRDLRVQ